MLREAYYAMVQGRNASIFAEEGVSDKHLHEARQFHTAHCFDYLRQSIMCSADMTLEWAVKPAPGKPRVTVDGWGMTHQCRSFEEARAWVLDHRAPPSHEGIA